MRYVIYGAGGCGRDIHASLVRSLEKQDASDTVVFCDNALAGQAIGGADVIRPPDIEPADRVLLAINNSHVREKLASGIGTASFVAATSLVSEQADIGDGAVISDFVIVGPSVRIGREFHANYYSYVAHDCEIGDYVTFGPGVRCNGNVTIGDHAYIGANASIRQGIAIGVGATVGMGAVVVKDVAPNTTVVGNPARPIRKAPLLRQVS